MKALIFDIDGTLWDTRAIVARGYNVELEKWAARTSFSPPSI